MDEIRIRTLEEYTKKIEGHGDTFFYRGVKNINYELIPSAGRFGIKDPTRQIQFERALIEEFKRKAPIYLRNLPKDDLEWLILAQHHGIPTRLMDWSFNPLIALFFAIENENDTDCAIYESHRHSGTSAPKTFDEIYSGVEFTPILPTLSIDRYANQASVFTLEANPTQFNAKWKRRKFIIEIKAKESIRWKLRRIGITKSIIYPSLDSLAYDIVETNKISYGNNFNK